MNNIKVVNRVATGVPKTMLDEHQLVRVFLNILTNAEQAMVKAGGKGQIDVYMADLGLLPPGRGPMLRDGPASSPGAVTPC